MRNLSYMPTTYACVAIGCRCNWKYAYAGMAYSGVQFLRFFWRLLPSWCDHQCNPQKVPPCGKPRILVQNYMHRSAVVKLCTRARERKLMAVLYFAHMGDATPGPTAMTFALLGDRVNI